MNSYNSRFFFKYLLAFGCVWAFTATTAHANPLPSPVSNILCYSALVFAFVCEVFITLKVLLVPIQSRRRIGVFIIFTQILTFGGLIVCYPTMVNALGKMVATIFVESAIVLAEGCIYFIYLRIITEKRAFLHCILASLAGNLTSFGVGAMGVLVVAEFL